MALLETCLILLSLLPCLIAGLSLAGAAGCRNLAQKILYEGLICVLEDRGQIYCKNQTRKKLKATIPLGQVSRLTLYRSPHFVGGELHWQWNKLWTMKIRKLVPRKQTF